MSPTRQRITVPQDRSSPPCPERDRSSKQHGSLVFKILPNWYPAICLKHFQEVSSFRFVQQTVVCTSHVTHTCYDPRWNHLPLFHHPDIRYPVNVTVRTPAYTTHHYAWTKNMVCYTKYTPSTPWNQWRISKGNVLLIRPHEGLLVCCYSLLYGCTQTIWDAKQSREVAIPGHTIHQGACLFWKSEAVRWLIVYELRFHCGRTVHYWADGNIEHWTQVS